MIPDKDDVDLTSFFYRTQQRIWAAQDSLRDTMEKRARSHLPGWGVDGVVLLGSEKDPQVIVEVGVVCDSGLDFRTGEGKTIREACADFLDNAQKNGWKPLC